MLVCIVLLIGLVTLFACNKSNVADKDGQTKVIVKSKTKTAAFTRKTSCFPTYSRSVFKRRIHRKTVSRCGLFEAAYKGFQSQKRRYGLRQMDDQ